MQTPAFKHFRRLAAQQAAALATPGHVQEGEPYTLMMAALYDARQTLHGIKSVENKIAKKRELLPQFEPYLQGVLEADKGAQDDVLLYCMVWYFDIGALETGLQLARYAIKHGLATPDKYARDTASLVAESIADECLKRLKAADAAETDVAASTLTELLLAANDLTADADMHDQIRAKLYKAIGYSLRAQQRHEDALASLQKALQLNEHVGVKKDIEQLLREIKNKSAGSES